MSDQKVNAEEVIRREIGVSAPSPTAEQRIAALEAQVNRLYQFFVERHPQLAECSPPAAPTS